MKRQFLYTILALALLLMAVWLISDGTGMGTLRTYYLLIGIWSAKMAYTVWTKKVGGI
jgi:hypothetical protein